MSIGREHPEHLLWFVAGQVDAFERASISRHLERCEDCRAEADSLTSMMKSMVAQTHLDHVAAEDLVVFEEEASTSGPDRATHIQKHLEECAGCREDLQTISQAREREMSAPRPLRQVPPPLRFVGHDIPAISVERPKRRWLPAAAACVVVMFALGVTSLARKDTRPAGPVPMKLVVLAAPQRGVESMTVLDAPGPWAVRVLLPYGTEPQTFKVSIRREQGGTLPRLDALALSDSEGCLDVIVPELPAAGRYELVLAPLSPVKPGDSEDRIYTFEYVTSARAPRAG